MWLMLQQATPVDLVIATGEQYSVRDFVERAAVDLGFDLEWRGSGLEERGIDRNSGKTLIEVDERYFRPTEVETLLGDASKAKEILGWVPKTSFTQLVNEMCASDLNWARSLL